MRLLRLEIENIASFENVTVDFTDPMLGDTDIFLISGETGSGKSTILDAICLALYGTTITKRDPDRVQEVMIG